MHFELVPHIIAALIFQWWPIYSKYTIMLKPAQHDLIAIIFCTQQQRVTIQNIGYAISLQPQTWQLKLQAWLAKLHMHKFGLFLIAWGIYNE